MRSEYGEVKRYLLNIISHHILKAIVRQIDAVVHILSSKPLVPQSLRVLLSHQSYIGGDISFVLRVVVQCMLPGTPPELSVEAETLAKKATSPFPSSGGENGSLLEKCPACGVEVPLTDTISAVCSNGHRWCESSITYEALPFVLIATIGHVSSLLYHIVHSGGNHGAHLPRLRAQGFSSCRAISISTGRRRECNDGHECVDKRYNRRRSHGRGPGHVRLACTSAFKGCASMSLLRE